MWKNNIVIVLAFFMQHTLFAQPAYHGLNLEKTKTLMQQARKKDREAAEILDSLRNLRWSYEELLTDAARNNISKKERLQLENDIADLKKEETNALKRRKEADERVREVEEMQSMTPDKLNKKIAAIEKKEGKIEVVFPETLPSEITPTPKVSEKTDKEAIANQEPPTTKKKKDKSNKEKKDKKAQKEPEPPSNETANAVSDKEQNAPVATEEPPKEAVVAANTPTKKEKKKAAKKEKPKKEDTPPPQEIAASTENPTPTERVKNDAIMTQNTETEEENKDKKKKKETPKNSKTNVQYAKYNPLLDPSVNPPKVPCTVVFEGQDAFTNRYKKELQSQMLFTHTEDFMRNALGNKEFITCKAQVTEVQGGFRYLNLQFIIASRDAQRSFGFVDKGSPIVFKLMNGNNVTLLNTKTDLGLISNDNNTTTYNLSMLVNKNDVRSLQNNELDVVRVAWSAGYEDYDILWTDVLQNIFRCIEK